MKLGMSREEVRRVMLVKLDADVRIQQTERDLFMSNGFNVYYDEEVCSGLSVFNLFREGYQVLHEGIDLFNLEWRELLTHFEQFDSYDSALLKKGRFYVFPKLGVSANNAQKQYDIIGGYKRKVFHNISLLDSKHITWLRHVYEIEVGKP